MDPRQPCPSCNKPEQPSSEEINRQADEYIDSLDGDIKTEPEIYKTRTDLCRSCDRLVYGTTCRSCGCFYLIRAAVIHRHCPHGKW